MLSSRIVFFRCFPVCIAFRIGFCNIFADSRLSAHSGFDLHLSLSSVWEWRGDGEGGDDVHANATCAFVDLIPVCSGAVHWWGVGGWGGVMTSMRTRPVSSVSFVDLIAV